MEVDDAVYLRFRHGRISIHNLRMEVDCWINLQILYHLYFNPQPPSGGWRGWDKIHNERQYFNPQPPSGGWRVIHEVNVTYCYFNPQPPSGGWRCRRYRLCSCYQFQSTTSIRRLTNLQNSLYFSQAISIHNLHPEVDFLISYIIIHLSISIHNLHPEVDVIRIVEKYNIVISIHNLHPEVDGILSRKI